MKIALLLVLLLSSCISLMTETRSDKVEVNTRRLERPQTSSPTYLATLDRANENLKVRVSASRRKYLPYTLKRTFEDRKSTTTFIPQKDETYLWMDIIAGAAMVAGGATMAGIGATKSANPTVASRTDGFGNRISTPDYSEPQIRTKYLALGIPLAIGGTALTSYGGYFWSKTGTNVTVGDKSTAEQEGTDDLGVFPSSESYTVETAFGLKTYRTDTSGNGTVDLSNSALLLYRPMAVVRFPNGKAIKIDVQKEEHEKAVKGYVTTVTSTTNFAKAHPQSERFDFLPSSWLSIEAVEHLPEAECVFRCATIRGIFHEIDKLVQAKDFAGLDAFEDKAWDENETKVIGQKLRLPRLAAAKQRLAESDSAFQAGNNQTAMDLVNETDLFLGPLDFSSEPAALRIEAASLKKKISDRFAEIAAREREEFIQRRSGEFDSAMRKKNYRAALDALRELKKTMAPYLLEEKRKALKSKMSLVAFDSYDDAIWIFPPTVDGMAVEDPSSHRGEIVEIIGSIQQAPGGGVYLVSTGSLTVYVTTLGLPNFMDGQGVKVLGKIIGTKTYQTIMGGGRTVPFVVGFAMKRLY